MSEETTPEITPAELRKKFFWVVFSITVASFMVRLDMYIINVSIPTIAREFDVTTSRVAWTVLIYILTVTSTLLFFGRLGDSFGLKRITLAGYGMFTAASLFCGLSWSLNSLIAARAIQGLGAALLTAACFALPPRILPRETTGWGFGILATGTALGMLVGAPIGGFIVTYFNWQGIFLINVPVGIAAMMLAVRVIPASADRHEKEFRFKSFDLPGTLLILAGIGLLVYAMNMGDEFGWASAKITGMFASSILLIVIFVLWEMRAGEPLLNLKLLKNHRFMFATMAGFFSFLFQGGFAFLVPYYLQVGQGIGAMKTGLILMIFSGVILVLSPAAGRISDRIEPSIQSSIAMLICVAASIFFVFLLDVHGSAVPIIFSIVCAIGLSQFNSPNNNQAMRLVPADVQGSAAGLFTTVLALGMMFGVSIFETIFSDFTAHAGNVSTLAEKGDALGLLSPGFKWAFAIGGISCLLSAIMSIAIFRKGGAARETVSDETGRALEVL